MQAVLNLSSKPDLPVDDVPGMTEYLQQDPGMKTLLYFEPPKYNCLFFVGAYRKNTSRVVDIEEIQQVQGYLIIVDDIDCSSLPDDLPPKPALYFSLAATN